MGVVDAHWKSVLPKCDKWCNMQQIHEHVSGVYENFSHRMVSKMYSNTEEVLFTSSLLITDDGGISL